MNVVRLGWGKRARLMQSSGTDRTPLLGVGWAKSKFVAAQLLRAAGIPVPPHELVHDEDAAVAAAGRIGYPVVVKPADQDGGDGATAFLQGDADVRAAFATARRLTRNVLVERHVDGGEFRLTVIAGKLAWAYQRSPASVVGDGIASVAGLVERANAQRVSEKSQRPVHRRIVVDQESHEMLALQGLAYDSVPEAGRTVRLQRIPKVRSGGGAEPVMDTIHPDNARLAERAARVMRLEVAGIDFISPDISRSWREGGGWITEVNAGPQISPASKADVFQDILPLLVERDGRVPLALVVGDGDGAVVAAVRRAMSATQIACGIAAHGTVTLDGDVLAEGVADPVRATAILLNDPTVEAVLVVCDAEEVLRLGLPVDRVGMLALAGDVADPRAVMALAGDHLAGDALAVAGCNALNPAAGAARLQEVAGIEPLAARLARYLSGGKFA
jgi:cyanophycin synthetase